MFIKLIYNPGVEHPNEKIKKINEDGNEVESK